MTMLARVSDPSVSASAAVMSSAMAVSSLPDAGCTVSSGLSATAVTVTAWVSVVWALLLPETTSMPIVKSASLFDGGVSLRPSSCALVSVIEPPVMVSVSPAVLVRLAPVGIPDRVTVDTSCQFARPSFRPSATAVSSAVVTAAGRSLPTLGSGTGGGGGGGGGGGLVPPPVFPPLPGSVEPPPEEAELVQLTMKLSDTLVLRSPSFSML